jgi:hypothetical protein
MPTSAEIKAEKQEQMGNRTTSGSSIGLVLPRLPFTPVHIKTAERSPELDQWHRNNHSALEVWREQTNIVLNRSATEAATQAARRTTEEINVLIQRIEIALGGPLPPIP